MRLIEKSDSPLRSQPQRTFNNTSWEPQAEASPALPWQPFHGNGSRAKTAWNASAAGIPCSPMSVL